MRGTFWYAIVVGFLSCYCLVDRSAASEEAKETAADEKKTATVASLTIRGSFPETSGQLGLFGEIESNLPELMRRLDRAAQDKDVSAVVLRIRNPTLGRGKVNELRDALREALEFQRDRVVE